MDKSLIERLQKVAHGPWKVVSKWTVVDAGGKFVADARTLYGGNMQWEPSEFIAQSRAELFAAVPDLLAALATASAREERLTEAIHDTLPRYIELFVAAGLGDPDQSVAVQSMRAALQAAGDGALRSKEK